MNPTTFELGVARGEITVFEPGIGMMGWGMLNNVALCAQTPLHARAFFLRDSQSDSRVVMVCCELAFITLALREAVCERLAAEHAELELCPQNVMLMATHTHSGPGGFSHYPFYNITIPGFSETVLHALAVGIVATIAEAAQNRQAGQVRYCQGVFEPELEVAFNRVVEAYNRNPDVTQVAAKAPHLALDRTMRMLRFDDAHGRPLGSINWFAVHGTNVHSDNTSLHFDNKGYAAQFFEEAMAQGGAPNYVAAFAQGATGDVTPNFRRHSKRPWVRGKYPDDDASARFNGRLQATKAAEVARSGEDSTPLTAQLATAHEFTDLADVSVDPRFSGRPRCRTAPAEIGLAMLFGTEEGPGLPRQLLFLQELLTAARPAWRSLLRRSGAAQQKLHDATHAEKLSVIESGARRFLGIRNLRKLPLPWSLHPALKLVAELHSELGGDKPWTPNILPLQLFRIGAVAISAVPAEFTTVSGYRLRKTVADALGDRVEHSVLAGYANAYSGYVTTAQEYALQRYEGASTHFGKWTLSAYQTLFERLAQGMTGVGGLRESNTIVPPSFSARELANRMFGAPASRA